MSTVNSHPIKIFRKWFPKRNRTANKGDCGRLFIIAGSRGFAGAGVLCSWGALRSGAGLVKLGVVKSQQGVAAKRAPLEVTTLALPETSYGQLSSSAWGPIKKTIQSFRADIVALGPGLGQSATVASVVKKVLMWPLPIVLDADGLNVFAKEQKIPHKGPLVITPHPGEMARLHHVSVVQVQRNREKYAVLSSQKFNCVCVLKGAGTLVAYGKKIYKNSTGNPGMATAGTGDVLTGILAGVWGQMSIKNFETGFQAACVSVYLHGLAGDLAAKKKARVGLVASDVAEMIPMAYKKLFGGRML